MSGQHPEGTHPHTPKEPPLGHLSDYLKNHRRLAGESVRGFAKLVGVSPDTASQILNKGRLPEDETLQKIANALPASMRKLRELAQKDRMAGRQLPEEAAWLDDDEWALMVALVRQFAKRARTALPATGPEPTNAGPQEQAASVTPIGGKSRDSRERVTRAAYKPPREPDK